MTFCWATAPLLPNSHFSKSFSHFSRYQRHVQMQSHVQQECIPVGCITSAAVSVCLGRVSAQVPRRVSAQGASAWGCLPSGVLPRVVSARRGSVQRGCLPREGVHLPLWTEFLKQACENITFPQLRLLTVINQLFVP